MKRLILICLSIVSVVVIAQQLQQKPSGVQLDKNTIAQLECKQDYLDTLTQFTIEKDGQYRIQCSTELLRIEDPKEYQGDYIQYFFDVNSDRLKAFDSKTDDRVFGTGLMADTSKATFKIKQTSGSSYVFETKMTWAKMGKQPKEGDMVGFDMAFSDNDGRGRETQVAWHAYDSELWINTSLFGRMKFVKSTAGLIQDDSTMYCVYSPQSPTIDGVSDAIWQKALSKSLNKVVLGTLKNNSDLNVKVRAVWNESGIYFLAEVADDKVAFAPGPLYNKCDYGWIEDSTGQKVWEIDALKAKHAGGAIKNKVVSESIALKAGKYTLHYISDESNSPAFWDDTPPTAPFYGISLKKQ